MIMGRNNTFKRKEIIKLEDRKKKSLIKTDKKDFR